MERTFSHGTTAHSSGENRLDGYPDGERLSLLHKLEGLLERAREGTDRRLLLTGQSLADELAAVEDLKQRIDALLQQHPALPGSESSE